MDVVWQTRDDINPSQAIAFTFGDNDFICYNSINFTGFIQFRAHRETDFCIFSLRFNIIHTVRIATLHTAIRCNRGVFIHIFVYLPCKQGLGSLKLKIMKKYFAEMLGTMILVLIGCGSAVFLGVSAPDERLAVAFAFGLSVLAMCYTIGGISGCHINPAITLGVWLSKRMSGKDALGYMAGQFIGAVIGSAIIYALVSTGSHGASTTTGANGFADGQMLQAFIAETVFTFIFVLVVLGTTDSEKGAGKFAGLAIGLSLVMIHIVCIPITGTSVNPARSFGPALFQGGAALSQLWLFIVAPFLGAILSAGIWKMFSCKCGEAK